MAPGLQHSSPFSPGGLKGTPLDWPLLYVLQVGGWGGGLKGKQRQCMRILRLSEETEVLYVLIRRTAAQRKAAILNEAGLCPDRSGLGHGLG